MLVSGVNVGQLKESIFVAFGPYSEYENEVNATYKDKSGEWRKAVFSKQRIVFLKLLKSHLMKEEKVGLLEDQYSDCLPASKENLPPFEEDIDSIFFYKMQSMEYGETHFI